MNPVENLAILVPLKGFTTAKSRLRDGGVADVDDLARSLAHQVLTACRPRAVFVACESRDVTEFALERGAEVIESSSAGLNEAVSHSYRVLSRRFERIVIAHGDLRNPSGLGQFYPPPGITIVTDSHRVGTNVLALPSGLDFTFLFGNDSAHAHQLEARRLGVEVHMEFDSPWRFDVDEPDDFAN
jgi:2-phospho-L-lactate guanylyltransferase (CobY/MobA/RfbA family)